MEKRELRQEYKSINVPPTKKVEEFLSQHPDMRLIGFDNLGINKDYNWGNGEAYKRDYSLTAIYASIFDFPELERIESQEIHAYVDLPGNSVDSTINTYLKKLNRPNPGKRTPQYQVALQAKIGDVYVAQRSYSEYPIVNPDAPVIGNRPEHIVVINKYQAPELQQKQYNTGPGL